MTVGVLAIQGAFGKHLEALDKLSIPALEVRSLDDLSQADRLIIPGGESTTVGMLLQRFGLGGLICERAREGMPIWGTCMGLILLAREVDRREQYTLGLLDVTVQRNAFGAQVHSFEEPVPFDGIRPDPLGVFIRAPVVTRIGEGVEVLSKLHGHVVAVKQGKVIGTSYHPELTEDRRVHEWFLAL